jgi:hypothetical protein
MPGILSNVFDGIDRREIEKEIFLPWVNLSLCFRLLRLVTSRLHRGAMLDRRPGAEFSELAVL